VTINAIIVLPPRTLITSHYGQQCLTHIQNRGYHLLTVTHAWQDVLAVMGAHLADVAVFARREHMDPSWAPRVEFVGQTTRDLRAHLLQRNAGHHGGDRRPRFLK
jgi:hypothetical protein